MAKNPKKKCKKQNYEVGYGKPPEQFKWQKGCPSPNPKGRPKKIRTLKEALQVSLNTEINTKTETGEIKKISCVEALARRTLADAISNDGPTRRMLYRYDIFNLVSKEPEIEYDKNETELLQVQEEYGKLLKQWAEMPVTVRETLRKILTEALRDILNNKFQKEN